MAVTYKAYIRPVMCTTNNTKQKCTTGRSNKITFTYQILYIELPILFETEAYNVVMHLNECTVL